MFVLIANAKYTFKTNKIENILCNKFTTIFLNPFRGESKTAATSKVEFFVIIVNDFHPLAIITKSSTLDVAAVLDPPLPFSNVKYLYK